MVLGIDHSAFDDAADSRHPNRLMCLTIVKTSPWSRIRTDISILNNVEVNTYIFAVVVYN